MQAEDALSAESDPRHAWQVIHVNLILDIIFSTEFEASEGNITPGIEIQDLFLFKFIIWETLKILCGLRQESFLQITTELHAYSIIAYFLLHTPHK